MPKYLYRCKTCGSQEAVVVTIHQDRPNPTCHGDMARDYKAEGISFRPPHPSEEVDPSLFLPMAKDFAHEDDPDGMKGLREWRERHKPAHKGGRHPEIS